MIKIHFEYSLNPLAGFSNLASNIIEACKGSLIKIVSANTETFSKQKPDVVFSYGMPSAYLTAKGKFPNLKHCHYFVWESSEIPLHYAEVYKKIDSLLTTSQYLVDVANKRGLESKIWHHLISPKFKYKPRPNDGIFTFINYGYEYRKGWELATQAFWEEFGVEEPVRLILKSRDSLPVIVEPGPEPMQMSNFYQHNTFNHPLIKQVCKSYSQEEMLDFLSNIDCFVGPHKGEGWYLPPFECAATGIVPIVTNCSSVTEWFNDKCMLDINVLGTITGGMRYTGNLYYPDTNHLKQQMRWALSNQDKITEMGQQCSKYVHNKFNSNKLISELYEHLSSL